MFQPNRNARRKQSKFLLTAGNGLRVLFIRSRGRQMVAFPYNGMVVDRFGNFYGAAVHGGEAGDGCVYKFTP